MSDKERAGKPKKRGVEPGKGTASRLLTESTPRRRWLPKGGIKRFPVILAVLTLLSGGAATFAYFQWYRPVQQTNPSIGQTVVKAASDGTVALLSYSPESLDADFAIAKSHLSGGFLSYYDHFSQEIVAPAAKLKSIKKAAHIMRAGLTELQPDSAVVLVFVDMSSTSKDSADPIMDASSVEVSMTRVKDKWLISDFKPL